MLTSILLFLCTAGALSYASQEYVHPEHQMGAFGFIAGLAVSAFIFVIF